MASAGNMDVEVGPVMRAALDALDLSADLADQLPDDHPGKVELQERGQGLIEMCQLLLKVQGRGGGK